MSEDEILPPPGQFFTAANGHRSFELADYPPARLMEVVEALQRHFGLDVDLPVIGLDEIACHGRIGGVTIGLGYDNWSGCYVMAFDAAGDEWVTQFGEYLNRHLEPLLRAAAGPEDAAPRASRPVPAPEHPPAPPAGRPAPPPPVVPGPPRPTRASRPVLDREVDALLRALARAPGLAGIAGEARVALRLHLAKTTLGERSRFRAPALKKLAPLLRTPADVRRAIERLGWIVERIPMDTTEDITGYHHVFDEKRLFKAIDDSADLDAFFRAWFGRP